MTMEHTTFCILSAGLNTLFIKGEEGLPDETGLVGTDSTLSRSLTVSSGAMEGQYKSSVYHIRDPDLNSESDRDNTNRKGRGIGGRNGKEW